MPSSDDASPDRATMNEIFSLCRSNKWMDILRLVQENPLVATTPMIMDNHISTTILHQAVTSKSNIQARAQVISHVLKLAPHAASIKNGYGSLPLHVICQRNTKMDSQTKEQLIQSMIKVYPKALKEEGGVGRRTPLHIAFTDYISPTLARMMIECGADAAHLKDKKGWLPIHVAVSRHCSPEKLHMLLKVHPQSLHAKTNLGESLLDLAQSTATKSHPNFALIAELKQCFAGDGEEDFEDEKHEPIAFRPEKKQLPVTRKRKAEAAELLLNFSRQHDPLLKYEYPTPVRMYPRQYPVQERVYQEHQQQQQHPSHRSQPRTLFQECPKYYAPPPAAYYNNNNNNNHQAIPLYYSHNHQDTVGETAQV